jgi:sigma-E factor negative regulatory protein RseC
MIEEIGIVTKVDGEMAKVMVQKKSACEGCTVQGACKSTENGMEIEAINAAHATEGQTVKIMMKPQVYLKGTMLVYGIPLVLFIAGAIAGKNFGEEYLTGMNSDLVAAVAGFSTLVLALLALKLWAKKTESDTENKPVIEEVVN